MIGFIILAFIVGIVAGVVLHGWAVKEDLKIAATVKKLVGEKVAAVKAEAAKVGLEIKKAEVEVKAEEKKL